MGLSVGEATAIRLIAEEFGVDPRFIAAIRLAENGGPGREFGVLSIDAPTYEDQLAATCRSVRNRLAEFAGNPLVRVDRPNDSRRLAYSDRFLELFAERWAPSGASNDPHGLNRHWLANVRAIYARLIMCGLSADGGREV